MQGARPPGGAVRRAIGVRARAPTGRRTLGIGIFVYKLWAAPFSATQYASVGTLGTFTLTTPEMKSSASSFALISASFFIWPRLNIASMSSLAMNDSKMRATSRLLAKVPMVSLSAGTGAAGGGSLGDGALTARLLR